MNVPRLLYVIAIIALALVAYRLSRGAEPTPGASKMPDPATESRPGRAEEPQKLQSTPQSATEAPKPPTEAQKRAEAFISGLEFGFGFARRNPDTSSEMAKAAGLSLWRQYEAQQNQAAAK